MDPMWSEVQRAAEDWNQWREPVVVSRPKGDKGQIQPTNQSDNRVHAAQ